MSPIKQPQSLQNLCLNLGSQVIIDYSYICLKRNVCCFDSKFKEVYDFLDQFVPSLMRSNFFHSLIKKMSYNNANAIQSEIIVVFLKALISADTRYLNFSDLIYAGSVDYHVLDSFDYGIGNELPSLPQLLHLDLSTHKCEVSLPSCSTNILRSIGRNCPNLRILNLNNNNRVTDDCLRYLAPHRHNQGCPLLEEIYIQECSVTKSAVIWMLRTFPYLKKIGYSDMGPILRKYASSYPRYRRSKLNLTYFDNSESTYNRSDRNVIHLISQICPYVENLRVRVCDQDCIELYKLNNLSKLELRFYTGIHHHIGSVSLNYLRAQGRYLTSLTIFCNELDSSHVMAVTRSCSSLEKLFLHANVFTHSLDFESTQNNLSHLQVLSIRIGQHEMDECESAAPLVSFLMSEGTLLQEVYLLLICKAVNHNFFHCILSSNNFPHLTNLIYDAPRRNRELPVIPLNCDTALLLVESCPSLGTLGNLISWQVSAECVFNLKYLLRAKNFEVNIIHSIVNKMNTKYY